MAVTHHVSVRLDASTLTRIDALIPYVSRARRSATRADVLRALIASALECNELPEIGADARGEAGSALKRE